MKVTIRLYKTHDFDLMALHQTGACNIAHAMKQAVIAYYQGQYFKILVQAKEKVKLTEMRTVVQLHFSIDNSDAEGILQWLYGFVPGSRNCCFKNILRYFLSPCIVLFRNDSWQPQPELSELKQEYSLPGKAINQQESKSRAKTGSDNLSKKSVSKKKIVKEKESNSSGTINITNQVPEEPPFDAFEAFMQLRGE